MTAEESLTPERCPHRSTSSVDGKSDAQCGLLTELSGVLQHPGLSVSIQACQACCDSYPPTARDLNPVVASLTMQLAEDIIDSGGIQGCSLEQARELCKRAERALPAVGYDEDDTQDIRRKNYDHVRDATAGQIAEWIPIPEESESPSKVAVDEWAVGITTAPRRMPTLRECAQSVLNAGWTNPVLFVDGEVEIPESIDHLETCHRTPALGAFPNYVLSLAELYMRQPHAQAYMIVQDDALFFPAPAMKKYVDQVLWPGTGPYIASLYCSKKYIQEQPGWHLFPRNWVWGAVAFVFSREALLQLLQSPAVYEHRALPDDGGLSKIDVVVGHFAQANEIPVIFPSPSLVQHIGIISTIWNHARAVHSRYANQFIGDLI